MYQQLSLVVFGAIHDPEETDDQAALAQRIVELGHMRAFVVVPMAMASTHESPGHSRDASVQAAQHRWIPLRNSSFSSDFNPMERNAARY